MSGYRSCDIPIVFSTSAMDITEYSLRYMSILNCSIAEQPTGRRNVFGFNSVVRGFTYRIRNLPPVYRIPIIFAQRTLVYQQCRITDHGGLKTKKGRHFILCSNIRLEDLINKKENGINKKHFVALSLLQPSKPIPRDPALCTTSQTELSGSGTNIRSSLSIRGSGQTIRYSLIELFDSDCYSCGSIVKTVQYKPGVSNLVKTGPHGVSRNCCGPPTF